MSFISNLLRTLIEHSLIRYGLVGLCVASLHGAVAMGLKFGFGVSPTVSNFFGFFAGATLSYLGSYYFTFKQPGHHEGGHKAALPKFALVWIIGIIVNVGIFKWILTSFGIPFQFTVLIAIVLTPILQYTLLRFWAFKKA